MQGRNPKQEIISQLRIGHIGLTHTLHRISKHPLTPRLYSIMTGTVKNAISASGERFSSVTERIAIRTLHPGMLAPQTVRIVLLLQEHL